MGLACHDSAPQIFLEVNGSCDRWLGREFELGGPIAFGP